MRMSKPSSEYWADRLSRQNQRIGDKTIQEMEARLRQYYRAASADISREAEALYQKILADAENGEVRPNDLYRLDRMYHLQSKIHNRLRELGVLEIELMDNKLRKVAEMVDKNTVSGLPDAAKNSPWAVLPREQAEAIVTRIWCADGENWSDRIWANKSALQHRLEKGLVDCIVRGVKNDVLDKTLMESFGVGYREASRIVRTETAHVQAEAEAAALEREGYEKYRFVNATDGRTCDECGKLNGKTFLMAERRAGVNFPPIHPNCRGRIVAVVTSADGTEVQPVIRGPKKKEQETGKAVENLPESAILNEDEQAAITSYISGESYRLNAKLRDGVSLEPHEQEMVNALDRALEKMPVFHGPVLRTLDLNRDDLIKFAKIHQIGNTVSYPAFTSTSIAAGYQENPSVILHIHSKSGRDIRAYNPEEQEVIFARNSRFKVLNVYPENNIAHIDMEEV